MQLISQSPSDSSEQGSTIPRHFSLHWIGLLYLACIAGLFFDTLAGPAFQRQLLRMRPASVAHFLARIAGVLNSEILRTLSFSISFSLLCIAYVWGCHRLQSSTAPRKIIWAWAFLFVLLLIPLPPHYADDLVSYAQQGKVLAVYHMNPYVHALEDTSDPWAVYPRGWRNVVPYGPVMAVLSAMAVETGRNNIILALLALKLIMSASFLLTAWTVSKILDLLKPSKTPWALFFFLWNPLVLLELIGEGHNDAVMMALMMVGLYLMVRSKHVAGFMALFFSMMTKFATIILLPLYASLLLRRREYRSLIWITLLCLATSLGFYFLFFRDPRSFDGVVVVSRLSWGSITWLGEVVLRQYTGATSQSAHDLIQRPLLVLFAVFLLWRMTKIDSEPTLLQESGLVMIFFMLIVANQMNPWYTALIIPLVAVSSTPLRCSIAFFLTAWPLARYFRPFFHQPPLWANLGRTLLFYGILVAIFWWHLRLQRLGEISRPERNI